MRPLLAALAALLIASPAHAVLGVIFEGTNDPLDPVSTGFGRDRAFLAVTSTMASLGMREGTDWIRVNPNTVNTEQVRQGTFSHGGATTSVDAWMIVDWAGRLPSGGRLPAWSKGLRTDSLTLSGATLYPRKPILFLSGSMENYTGGAVGASDGSGGGYACTTGVAASKGWSTIASTMHFMSDERTGAAYLPGAHPGSVVLNSTPPAGGLRVLVRSHPTSAYVQGTATQMPYNYATNFDSLVAQTADTVSAWVRPMSHITGAAPLVFANSLGASANCGTGSPCEGDALAIVACLAYVDSVTSGAVFNHKALPLRMGLVIRGGLTSGASRYSGGLYLDDSTAFKASLDSLSSRRIPAVFAVDWMCLADSSANITASQKGWLSGFGAAKFAPELQPRTDAGDASWSNPIDPFGYERARIFYGGESCNTGGAADTSMYCLLRSARWHLDSIPEFKNRTAAFAVPYLDDWLPSGKVVADRDSALFVIRKVFPGGVLIDAQDGTNESVPRRWNIRADGSSINLLGYMGNMVSGSRLLADFRADSTAPYAMGCCGNADGQQHIPGKEVHRAWGALLLGQNDVDIFATDSAADDYDQGVNTALADRTSGVTRRSNIVVFHVNDFGAGTTPARRPAWWAIKSIDNAMRAVNGFGTTVVTWDYPENMEP